MGRTYLVLTVGVGLAALNTGNNLLYLLLGLLLSVIVLSGVLSERNLRDLEVRRVGAEAAHAGEPFAFRWALRRRRSAGFALLVSEADSPLSGEGKVAWLAPGVEHVVRGDLLAPRRGPLALSGVRVTTSYPLGIFAKTRFFPLEGSLLVYPARGFSCEAPPSPLGGPAGEVGSPRHSDGSGDLVGLRELAEGEDVRRVHWLKSASAGRLLRTEREREERRTYVLQVDPTLPLAALDRRCEQVAAQARLLLADGGEVGLVAGTFRLRPAAGPGQLRRVLRALALLGHTPLRSEEAA
jgi:uncharacterized protein (DUF58 family)